MDNITILSRLYFWLGSSVCHQIPERTIHINEMPLPICARDAGIYLGVFIVMVYCIIRRRLQADKPPSIAVSIVLAVLMIPMMIDAVSSYASIRQTNNTIRFVTGIFFGMSIAVFLIPAANYKVYEPNKIKILNGFFDVILLMLVAISMCFIVLKLHVLTWWMVSTACLTGLVFIIARFAYTVIGLQKTKKGIRLIGSLISTVMFFCVVYMLKHMLLQIV